MYPLLYTGAASVGIHYSRMRTETIRYFKIPSKTSLSSHKLDKFDSVKTSRSRILYSSSGYTLGTSPSVVHSSGTAVRCSPQTCKIIGVCTHSSTQYRVYYIHTRAAHAADLTIFCMEFLSHSTASWATHRRVRTMHRRRLSCKIWLASAWQNNSKIWKSRS